VLVYLFVVVFDGLGAAALLFFPFFVVFYYFAYSTP